MSFIFSRALVAEYSQADCLAVDAYAPSRLIPTPKRSSLLGKTTEPFLRSRFGMTFEPLTDDVGEELLTSWLEGFPVKTSAQPAPETASTASGAGYGSKWRASFARFDRSESKWKTAQCSLLGDSDEFSETWPRWGSMRNGESFLRPIPALPICENASGLWPTTTVCGNHNMPGASKSAGWGSAEKLWPTPTASLASKGGRITPRKGREGGTLIEAVSSRMFPTPVADNTGHRKSKYAQGGTALSTSVGGQLNPEWVEWLMGWPIGHTALEPLATAKYREWLQQHSSFSQETEDPSHA
jgi:hypothetical protein